MTHLATQILLGLGIDAFHANATEATFNDDQLDHTGGDVLLGKRNIDHWTTTGTVGADRVLEHGVEGCQRDGLPQIAGHHFTHCRRKFFKIMPDALHAGPAVRTHIAGTLDQNDATKTVYESFPAETSRLVVSQVDATEAVDLQWPLGISTELEILLSHHHVPLHRRRQGVDQILGSVGIGNDILCIRCVGRRHKMTRQQPGQGAPEPANRHGMSRKERVLILASKK